MMGKLLIPSLLRFLCKNPLYFRIWQPMAASTCVQMTTKGTASCCFSTPTDLIEISSNGDFYDSLEQLIFETANLHQKKRFCQIYDLASEGKLSQEQFTRRIEYLEYCSFKLMAEIIQYGVDDLKWPEKMRQTPSSFDCWWHSVNFNSSHANHYRKEWLRLNQQQN